MICAGLPGRPVSDRRCRARRRSRERKPIRSASALRSQRENDQPGSVGVPPMCRCGFFRSSARLRALSPSAEVLNIRLAYPISSVIGAGQPEDKARQGPPKKTSRQPVGPLRLAPAHSTLRIQECPQRQIFRAGACSVKKLLDIPYPWCARRMRDLAHVARRSALSRCRE